MLNFHAKSAFKCILLIQFLINNEADLVSNERRAQDKKGRQALFREVFLSYFLNLNIHRDPSLEPSRLK